MTDQEFIDELAHRLGLIRTWALREGRVVIYPSGEVLVRPVETETVQRPPAEAARQAGYTGNMCAACGHPTRMAGACELCDNCGATTSCG